MSLNIINLRFSWSGIYELILEMRDAWDGRGGRQSTRSWESYVLVGSLRTLKDSHIYTA
jgi:hypothetical protein